MNKGMPDKTKRNRGAPDARNLIEQTRMEFERGYNERIEALRVKYTKLSSAELTAKLLNVTQRYTIEFQAALLVACERLLKTSEEVDTLKKNTKRIGEIISHDFGECDETEDTEELNILLGYTDG